MSLFINKAWPYGEPNPDHTFLALNYRLSEIQAAVALAQLQRLPSFVERRISNAEIFGAALEGMRGIFRPFVRGDSLHTYWRYALRVDADIVPGSAVALGAKLNNLGVPASPRYIKKPAFECEIFQRQQTLGRSRWPFTLARAEALDYRATGFPGVYSALENMLVLPWNERFEPQHLEFLVRVIRKVLSEPEQRTA